MLLLVLFSLIVFTLLAWWFDWPKLKEMEWEKAVLPLVMIHAFRYIFLVQLLAKQNDTSLFARVNETIVFANVTVSILALVTAFFLALKVKGRMIMVVIFTLVGIVLGVISIQVGYQLNILTRSLEVLHYLIIFYMPILVISHILIIRLLLMEKKHK